MEPHIIEMTNIMGLAVKPGADLSAILSRLTDAGFSPQFYTPADDHGPEVHTMQPLKDSSILKLTIDDLTGVAFFEVSGNAENESLKRLLELNVTLDWPSILKLIQEEERLDYLTYYAYSLGIVGPNQPNDAVIKAIVSLFHHQNSELRRTAAFSTSYFNWKEFMPYLRDLILNDEVLEVREMAANAMDIIEEYSALKGQRPIPGILRPK